MLKHSEKVRIIFSQHNLEKELLVDWLDGQSEIRANVVAKVNRWWRHVAQPTKPSREMISAFFETQQFVSDSALAKLWDECSVFEFCENFEITVNDLKKCESPHISNFVDQYRFRIGQNSNNVNFRDDYAKDEYLGTYQIFRSHSQERGIACDCLKLDRVESSAAFGTYSMYMTNGGSKDYEMMVWLNGNIFNFEAFDSSGDRISGQCESPDFERRSFTGIICGQSDNRRYIVASRIFARKILRSPKKFTPHLSQNRLTDRNALEFLQNENPLIGKQDRVLLAFNDFVYESR